MTSLKFFLHTHTSVRNSFQWVSILSLAFLSLDLKLSNYFQRAKSHALFYTHTPLQKPRFERRELYKCDKKGENPTDTLWTSCSTIGSFALLTQRLKALPSVGLEVQVTIYEIHFPFLFLNFTTEKAGQKCIKSIRMIYSLLHEGVKQPKAASHQLSRRGKREVMNFTDILPEAKVPGGRTHTSDFWSLRMRWVEKIAVQLFLTGINTD